MHRKRPRRRPKPSKRYPGALKPLLVGVGVVFITASAYPFLNGFFEPKPDENITDGASQAWYLQQARAPELITLPDTPLILAPTEAEIDETIEIVAPLSPTPPKTPPADISATKTPPNIRPRLDDIEIATKPVRPVVVYEEPLSEAIHSPKPTIVQSALTQQNEATNPELIPTLKEPTFEERFETVQTKPRWAQNAIEFEGKTDRPMIAVVIDDLGLDLRRTRQTLDLAGPLTMAFIPYAKNLNRQTTQARALGHELMLHLPMEPLNANIDAGPNHLTAKLSEEGLSERLHWNLNRFEGYVGVNNHMGSRATADPKLMTAVLTELRNREMMFLDSRTNPKSVGAEIAKTIGIPFVERNVFLDNDNSVEYVLNQLSILERVSKKRGYAIGIGHPRDATIAALTTWLPTLEGKGFSLVPISQIILKQEARS